MPIPSAQQPVYMGAVVVDVTRWSGNWSGRLAEVTNSGSTGTRYAPVIPDPSWQVDLPLDDPNFPEVIGWYFGQIIPVMYFKHSSKADKLTNTTIESVEKSADATADVPRVTVRGKGGTLTYNVVPGVG